MRAALEHLNLALPPEVVDATIEELIRDRSAILLERQTSRFIGC